MDTSTTQHISTDGTTTLEIGTIDHEGHTYQAQGSMVSPTHAIGYLSVPVPAERTDPTVRYITTWDGQRLGIARITKAWRIRSYWSTHMYQVYARINGTVYQGRTMGDNMIWRGKRVAHASQEN